MPEKIINPDAALKDTKVQYQNTVRYKVLPTALICVSSLKMKSVIMTCILAFVLRSRTHFAMFCISPQKCGSRCACFASLYQQDKDHRTPSLFQVKVKNIIQTQMPMMQICSQFFVVCWLLSIMKNTIVNCTCHLMWLTKNFVYLPSRKIQILSNVQKVL